MIAPRHGCNPIFYPKCTPLLSWPHKFESRRRLRRPPTSLAARTRNAASARRGPATAASNKAAEAATALWHLHTEDWALAVAKEAERHAAEVADGGGRWAGSVRLRRASRSKTADRCPLNRVVMFKRRPERRCVGRLSGFGLQYALMPMSGSCRSEYLYAALYTANDGNGSEFGLCGSR